MNIRVMLEAKERKFLSPRAQLSSETKGRVRPEPPCDIRPAFQQDRDRILHCKAFRRLKHKTQVFLAPKGDHYRTRLTHTLEVSQLARTIAKALSLNEDLTEAIALGHDLGHTPFGHAGEAVLDEILPGGFHHAQQSLRVVDLLEKDGAGLNLTYEVREGIAKHSKGKGPLMVSDPEVVPATLEGQIVRFADLMAYVNHDADDAVRAGIISVNELPEFGARLLGTTGSQRIDRMIRDAISETIKLDCERIALSPDVWQAIDELRDFLFKRVYEATPVINDFRKASKILKELYGHFASNPDDFVKETQREMKGENLTQRICDFLAGMTDQYALNLYNRIFMPEPWAVY